VVKPTGDQSSLPGRIERVKEVDPKPEDFGALGGAAIDLSRARKDARHARTAQQALIDATDNCDKQLTAACLVVGSLVAGAQKDSLGRLVPDEVSRKRLVGLFGDMRVQQVAGHKEIMGAVVRFQLGLAGLREREVQVTWTLYGPGTLELSPRWVRANTAFRVKATTDDDSIPLSAFVPLPRHQGPFRVELEAYVDTSRVAAESTGLFN
jgi:hypothetical protein